MPLPWNLTCHDREWRYAQDVSASIDAGELLVVYKAYIKIALAVMKNEILLMMQRS